MHYVFIRGTNWWFWPQPTTRQYQAMPVCRNAVKDVMHYVSTGGTGNQPDAYGENTNNGVNQIYYPKIRRNKLRLYRVFSLDNARIQARKTNCPSVEC